MRVPCLFDEAWPPSEITPLAVWSALSDRRFNLSTEAATQLEMDAALVLAFGREAVSREHRLSRRDRPDFLIGGRVVVEVKGPRHQWGDVLRQLERYASHPEVEAIILATSRAMRMPNALVFGRGGDGERRVAIRVLNLGRAWL